MEADPNMNYPEALRLTQSEHKLTVICGQDKLGACAGYAKTAARAGEVPNSRISKYDSETIQRARFPAIIASDSELIELAPSARLISF